MGSAISGVIGLTHGDRGGEDGRCREDATGY
jgi:hypothetical protein